MRGIIVALAAFAMVGLTNGVVPVAAQTDAADGAAQQPRELWSVQCSTGARDAPVDCAIEQRAVVSESGQLLTLFTIRVPADTRKPVMMIQTPLGLRRDNQGERAASIWMRMPLGGNAGRA
jgi:invasion protein IalB